MSSPAQADRLTGLHESGELTGRRSVAHCRRSGPDRSAHLSLRGTIAGVTESITGTKRASDLGASLRNRTVDLLLTMGNQHVAVVAAEPLTRPDTSSRELAQVLPCCR